MNANPPQSGSTRLPLACAVLAAAGTAGFVAAAVMGGESWRLRAWQDLLLNWLFWTGMAQGGVAMAAIFEVTGSGWGRPLKRMMEGMAAFMPVSLALLGAIYFGMHYLYPWVDAPVPGREVWLSRELVIGRDLLALVIMFAVSLAYVYYSVRPDLGDETGGRLRAWIRRGWRGDEAELQRALAIRPRLAAGVLAVYAVGYSLVAYDLVMSITPTWHSTLFGAYVCIINLYGVLALTALLASAAGGALGVKGAMGHAQYHDLGKLLFGFTILAMDFFWSQFLVVWYGNLPEETGYALIRAFSPPWIGITWTVLMGAYVAPFLLLMRRRMKTDPRRLGAVALMIVIVIWLERFLLVVPSTWPGPELPLGPLEALITAGVGGMFLGSLWWFQRTLPPAPVSDPLFQEAGAPHHVVGEQEWVDGERSLKDTG